MEEKFECILSFTFKNVKPIEELKLIASKNWKTGISDFKNCYIPKEGDEVSIYKKRGYADSHDALIFIKNNKSKAPNAIGLIPIINTLKQISLIQKTHFFVLGLDENQNLKYKSKFGHVVPYIFFNNGEVSYGWFPQGVTLDEDEWIMEIK